MEGLTLEDGDEETELLQSVKRIWDYYQPAASGPFLMSPEDRVDMELPDNR